MSYGTRKAIAGAMRAADRTAEAIDEAVRRFEACRTPEDVAEVLAWARRRGGWLHRTAEDDRRLRAAHAKARAATSAPALTPSEAIAAPLTPDERGG